MNALDKSLNFLKLHSFCNSRLGLLLDGVVPLGVAYWFSFWCGLSLTILWLIYLSFMITRFKENSFNLKFVNQTLINSLVFSSLWVIVVLLCVNPRMVFYYGEHFRLDFELIRSTLTVAGFICAYLLVVRMGIVGACDLNARDKAKKIAT